MMYSKFTGRAMTFLQRSVLAAIYPICGVLHSSGRQWLHVHTSITPDRQRQRLRCWRQWRRQWEAVKRDRVVFLRHPFLPPSARRRCRWLRFGTEICNLYQTRSFLFFSNFHLSRVFVASFQLPKVNEVGRRVGRRGRVGHALTSTRKFAIWVAPFPSPFFPPPPPSFHCNISAASGNSSPLEMKGNGNGNGGVRDCAK